MKKLKIYLVAGEPSGDLLGSRLMRAFKKKYGARVAFYGVGGETMVQEGLTSLFDIRDLAVMGIFEVVPSIPRILRHLDNLVADIEKVRPDIVITIDAYSFSARVHGKIKKAGIGVPHVHYVAPQVWAWKKKRAKKVHQIFDHLFTLLPFEAKHFEPHGMKTTFVGHPVVESVAGTLDGQSFRRTHKIPAGAKVMVMLPGSRRNEVKYLLHDFMKTAELVQKKYPNLYVVIPTVKTVEETVRAAVEKWPVAHLIVVGEANRYHAFAAANVALAASGTVSLELAMSGVPHVIAYRVNKLTAYIARRLIKIKYVNLINILSNQEIIPEMIQEKSTPEQLAAALEKVIQNPAQNVMPALKRLGVGDKLTPSEKVVERIGEWVKK